MNTKLILTVEQELLNKATEYAKAKNRSLPDLIENYLKMLTTVQEESQWDNDLDPTIESLRGSFEVPKDFDYKKELQNRLEEKYL